MEEIRIDVTKQSKEELELAKGDFQREIGRRFKSDVALDGNTGTYMNW